MVASLPPGVDALVGAGRGAGWKDRVRQGAYIPPSGEGDRITFEFMDLQRTYDLRGTSFEFPGVDNAYVQRKGFGPRKYPMLCYFSGRDHDLVATAFEAALCQKGIGKLEHPFYSGAGKNEKSKTFDVVPFGTVTRDDRLATAANQTTIEVTFWTTLREVYPRDATDPKSEIQSALDGFDQLIGQLLDENASLDNAVDQANAKATVKAFLRNVKATLNAASDAVASVRREFDDAYRLVNEGIDILIGQPILLAQQVNDLIHAPARAIAGIRSRLEGYAALLEHILTSPAANPSTAIPSLTSDRNKVLNDFYLSYLFASSAVAGSVASVVNNEFETKADVIAAADEVARQFDQLVTWADRTFAAVQEVDTGEPYAALQEAVATTVGYLIQVSFTKLTERRIILERARTIIDLAAELYGDVGDATLNKLINNNDLTGSQILEIQAGTTIVYYPAA